MRAGGGLLQLAIAAAAAANAAVRLRPSNLRKAPLPRRVGSTAMVIRAGPQAQIARESNLGWLAPSLVAPVQNRGSSGCGALAACTCIAPNSAQRARVGTALPGFSRPCG